MFRTDVELVEKTLQKISKERHKISDLNIIRWFDFEINKRSEVRLFIIYKIENLEPMKRSIFIDGNHISVSYIKRMLDEDMTYVKKIVIGKITESEW